jgi:hypothetical protein
MRTTRGVRSVAAARASTPARAPVPNPAATQRPPSGPSRRRQWRSSSPFPRAPSAPPLPHLRRCTGAPPPSFLAPTKQGPRRRVGGEGQLGRHRPRDPGGDGRHPELRWQPSSVAGDREVNLGELQADGELQVSDWRERRVAIAQRSCGGAWRPGARRDDDDGGYSSSTAMR